MISPPSHDLPAHDSFYKETVEMPKKQRGGTCDAMCPMQGGYMSPSQERGVGKRSVPTGGYISTSQERGVDDMSSPRKGGVGARSAPTGYYRPTARNRYFLKRYKQGKSIGFTMRSSLKAKGLIPRANGTKRVSAKYRGNM